MKKILSLTLALLLAFALTACGANQSEAPSKPATESSKSEKQEQEGQPVDTAKRVRFLAGENEIIVRLEDNSAADSLYEMLPMELRFEDYNGTEKIAYPDEALTTNGAPDHCTPQRGDLCFYAP